MYIQYTMNGGLLRFAHGWNGARGLELQTPTGSSAWMRGTQHRDACVLSWLVGEKERPLRMGTDG